jgi:hypothetical protein
MTALKTISAHEQDEAETSGSPVLVPVSPMPTRTPLDLTSKEVILKKGRFLVTRTPSPSSPILDTKKSDSRSKPRFLPVPASPPACVVSGRKPQSLKEEHLAILVREQGTESEFGDFDKPKTPVTSRSFDDHFYTPTLNNLRINTVLSLDPREDEIGRRNSLPSPMVPSDSLKPASPYAIVTPWSIVERNVLPKLDSAIDPKSSWSHIISSSKGRSYTLTKEAKQAQDISKQSPKKRFLLSRM